MSFLVQYLNLKNNPLPLLWLWCVQYRAIARYHYYYWYDISHRKLIILQGPLVEQIIHYRHHIVWKRKDMAYIFKVQISNYTHPPPLCRIYASVNRASIGSDNGCRLFGAKPLSKSMLVVNSTLRNKLQWNFNQNTNLFIHQDKMAAIFSKGRWVKHLSLSRPIQYRIRIAESFDRMMNPA